MVQNVWRESFNICLIDDDSFSKINTQIGLLLDMNKIGTILIRNPMIRALAMAKLLLHALWWFSANT